MSTEKINGIPGVSKKEPTQKQIDLLKKQGKYKESMSFEEASETIDELPPPDFMKPGLNLVKIKSISIATNDKGNITDKDGNPGIKIIFINKDKEMISDIFFYSEDKEIECKSEWKLRKLKYILGLKFEKENKPSEIKGKKFWLLVQKTILTTEEGEVIKNENNEENSFSKATSNYYKQDKKPILSGDPEKGEIGGKFLEYRKDYNATNKKNTNTEEIEEGVEDEFEKDNGKEKPNKEEKLDEELDDDNTNDSEDIDNDFDEF